MMIDNHEKGVQWYLKNRCYDLHKLRITNAYRLWRCARGKLNERVTLDHCIYQTCLSGSSPRFIAAKGLEKKLEQSRAREPKIFLPFRTRFEVRWPFLADIIDVLKT